MITHTQVNVAALPWSNGAMSARVWRFRHKTIACVPELGLYCYGINQSEALFRLFTILLKYYRQLRLFKNRLGERGASHLELLSAWVSGMEKQMTLRTKEINLVIAGSSKHDAC